ncbi:hypothetical protein C8R43DRAFT_1156717 [Mycena crocata]|nr:hypothetical protein C8R43DRAFT_1156717 [Mycena crocata]
MNSSQVDYSAKLPTEVWARCWSQCDPRDLRRLVSVCRYFRELCHPLLFQHQQFRAPDYYEINRHSWMSTTQYLHRSAIRVRKLIASTHVASVRSWRFCGSFEYPSLVQNHPNIVNVGLVSETYLNLARLFVETLSSFQNLRSLSMVFFTLDTEMRETLVQLGRLTKLELISCDILSRSGTPLSLEEFKLGRYWHEGGDTEEQLNLVAPEGLRALNLSGYRDCNAILSALTSELVPLRNLVTLSIELADGFAGSFLALLELCPQLTELDILKSSLSGLPNRLAATAIPRLRSFKGPRLLTAFFIADRPVTLLTLAGGSGFSRENKPEKNIIRDLVQIAHSSSTVDSFSMIAPMRSSLQICGVISTHWPNLRELSLALRETPPPPRPILPMDDDEYEAYEESSTDDELDERTLELSDNDSLKSIVSYGRARIYLSPDSDLEDEPDPIPDVLLPGHMYSTMGKVSRPPGAQAATLDDPDTFRDLRNCLTAERISLPDSLQCLRLIKPQDYGMRSTRALMDTDHHAVILALERRLPGLCELDFGGGCLWRRYRSIWTQMASGIKIASLVSREA